MGTVHILLRRFLVIIYQVEPLATARRELDAVLPIQYAETGEDFPLDPYWPLYEALEAKGSLLFVARERPAGVLSMFPLRGRLVGYLVCLIHPHLNAKTARVASIPTYWVEPRAARAGILRGLIRATLAHLQPMGLARVSIDTHARLSAGRLLLGMGFRPAKISYNLG